MIFKRIKKSVSVLFLYLFAINTIIASSSIDSLQLLWSQEKDPIEKFSIGRQITLDYIFVDLEKALHFSNSLLILGRKIGGFDYWDARLLKSDILRRMNKEAESLELLLTLLEEAEQQQWNSEIAKASQTIGLVYSALEEKEKAVQFLNRAINIYTTEDSGDAIFALSDLSEIYLLAGDTLLSRDVHLKMIRIAEKLKKPKVIEHILFWMEDLSSISQQCNYTDAQLKMVLHYSKVVENHYSELFFLLIQMGCLSEKGAFKQLTEFGENSQEKFQAYKDVQLLHQYYGLMDKAYMQQGRWHKAYEMLKEYNILENKIFNKKKDASIINKELRYQELQNETLKQEKTAALKDKQQRSQRNTWLVATLVLLLLFLLLYWDQREAKQKLEKEQMEQEIWRLQFNPHFFFNALTSIQAFLYQKDASRAIKAISRLSGMFRRTLSLSEVEWTGLNEEIEYVKEYVTIHKFMSGDKFKFETLIDCNIKESDIQVPPLLIQPIIENAIKHGLQGMDEKGQLRLDIKLHAEALRICISNNGAKFKITSNTKSSSLGLKITNKRLQKYELNQTGVKIENNMHDGENWVEVSFLLPFKTLRKVKKGVLVD